MLRVPHPSLSHGASVTGHRETDLPFRRVQLMGSHCARFKCVHWF